MCLHVSSIVVTRDLFFCLVLTIMNTDFFFLTTKLNSVKRIAEATPQLVAKLSVDETMAKLWDALMNVKMLESDRVGRDPSTELHSTAFAIDARVCIVAGSNSTA